jgi:3-hydroxybutyryl-CoA dehydrogenase
MGAGIAHAFLACGSRVLLRDVTPEAVERGVATVTESLRVAFERGTVASPPAQILERLETAADISDFGDIDLAVEAVPESLELKRRVWSELSQKISESTILASNTSSISIGALASAVAVPGRFLGMHFFNPVPVSKLVELVRGPETMDATVVAAAEWVSAIDKESIVAADVPGFATSRLGVAIGLEAIRMLEDGVASAADIDRAMVLGYGLPVGPLRLTDIVGLDVRLEIAEYLTEAIGERFAPPALLRTMVEQGNLGRKAARGFYNW